MKVNLEINFKKKHFYAITIFFLVGIFSFYVIGSYSGGFNPNEPTHELIQIVDSNGESIDQDADGIIDKSNDADTIDGIDSSEFFSPNTNTLTFEVYNSDTTIWDCVTQNLEEQCGDFDGCTIRLLMQHETNSNDQVKIIDENIYMEQSNLSNNNGAGIYGWTREMGGADASWITGTNDRYGMFSPWNWLYMYNYVHDNCQDQEEHSQPHTDPYNFTFMSHPNVRATVIVKD